MGKSKKGGAAAARKTRNRKKAASGKGRGEVGATGKREPSAKWRREAVRECPADTPRTPDELHKWIEEHLDVRIARAAMVEGHAAPFEYLVHTFFEGAFPRGIGPSAQDMANTTPGDPSEHGEPEPRVNRASRSSGASKATAHVLRRDSPDCIVWANRGGGKTFLAAIATLLDLLFKPGCQVRVLAGSMEQGLRMHAHLREFLEREVFEDVPHRITARRISIPGRRTSVEILAASQTSVRGTRVQKLRCDEVDLFDAHLWSAAQLVTRSLAGVRGPWGERVRGSVEALSTMHRPFGLMWKLVGDPGKESSTARARNTWEPSRVHAEEGAEALDVPRSSEHDGRPSDAATTGEGGNALDVPGSGSVCAPGGARALFRWGVLDVLEHCPPERACGVCALEPECRGRAKFTPLTCEGHFTVDDATSMKMRVGREVWEAEMLCLRPSRSSAVYPEFDVNLHVRSVEEVGDAHDVQRTTLSQSRQGSGTDDSGTFVKMIAGFDFGYRCEAVILLAGVTRSGRVHVIREHCKREQIVAQQIDAMERWREEGLFRFENDLGEGPPLEFVGVDPAGNSQDGQTGLSCAQLLVRRGYPVRARASQIYPGLLLVREHLSPAWTDRVCGLARRSGVHSAPLPPRTPWGPALFRGDHYDPIVRPEPRLLIDPRCTRLIECLSRYHFDEGKQESLDPVKDGFDHACDALRYMILNLVRPMKCQTSNYLAR